jgi:formate-dependent nitrite reductase complex subunit NrfG
MILRHIASALLRSGTRQVSQALPGATGETLSRELQQDLREAQATQATQGPAPARLLSVAAIVVTLACLTGYGLSSRLEAVVTEQARLADPLNAFSPEGEPDKPLTALQDKIRATPQDSALWATLGEYYLYRNAYDNALLAYQRALTLRGENAELYAALATVLYYQAGQNMTPGARKMIDRALALDADEVTALMLLASDAFMTADYKQAITLWQQLLDANSPRVDRAKLIDAINLATMLKNQQQ